METIIIVVHVLAALAIIGLILLQQGKGADMGASFGAGGSQTLFGSRGSGNFFSRATAVIAAVFFFTSFSLAVIAKNKAGVDDEFQLDLPVDEVPAVEEVISDVPMIDDGIDSGIPAVDDTAPAVDSSDAPDLEETPAAN